MWGVWYCQNYTCFELSISWFLCLNLAIFLLFKDDLMLFHDFRFKNIKKGSKRSKTEKVNKSHNSVPRNLFSRRKKASRLPTWFSRRELSVRCREIPLFNFRAAKVLYGKMSISCTKRKISIIGEKMGICSIFTPRRSAWQLSINSSF